MLHADAENAARFDYVALGSPTVHPSEPTYESAWWRSPNRDLAATVGLGYATHSGLVGPGGMEYPESASKAYEAASKAYEALPGARRAAYDKSLNECSASAFSSSELVATTKSQALEFSMIETLTTVSREPSFAPTRDTVARCIRDHGEGFSGPDDIYDYAEGKVLEILGDASRETPGVAELVAKALAVETNIATIEVDCRSTVANQAADLLQPAFDAWYAKNRDEINALHN